MKRFIFIILVFLFNFVTPALAITPKKSETLWAYLSKMHTYRANFEQTTRDANGQVVQRSYGSMALIRPGYLKWETIAPTHQLLFVNRNTVWIYDVDLEQASKSTLSTPHYNNSGALLSSSVAQIRRQFHVDSVKIQQGQTCFILHKKQTTTDDDMKNDKITLCFKNAILQSMALTHHFGDETQFVFSNIRTNHLISLSIFQFTPPDGVEIIDQSKL